MTKFSEQLKYLIEESGNNIYQLAKKTGLDRTTIQRAITGERLPGLSFVEKLCESLRVSPPEQKNLMEIYSITKMGEKIYSSRQYVKNLIEQIATLHIQGNNNIKLKKAVSISGDIDQKYKVLTDQYSINNIIRDVLEDEVFNKDNPHICLTIPFEYSYLFDCLKQLYWESSGQVVIEHIVRLNKNPHREQDPNVNLKMLSHALPLAFCIGNGYQPHYYYTSTDIAQDISLVMPYYIHTSKRLLTVSSDFKTAILFNNEDIKLAYYMQFQKSLAHTTPFIHQMADCSDMILTYLKALSNSGHILSVIEPQPCFAKYYTHKMIEEHLRPEVPDRETVKEVLFEYYDNCNITPCLKSFFSIEGLKYFTATGILADLPTRFALPFTAEERKRLLCSLRDDVIKDNYIVHAIDTSKFQISSLTSIQLFAGKGLLFCATDNDRIISCYIDEQSIYDAFHDFSDSLLSSDLVFNKEETIKILNELINILR